MNLKDYGPCVPILPLGFCFLNIPNYKLPFLPNTVSSLGGRPFTPFSIPLSLFTFSQQLPRRRPKLCGERKNLLEKHKNGGRILMRKFWSRQNDFLEMSFFGKTCCHLKLVKLSINWCLRKKKEKYTIKFYCVIMSWQTLCSKSKSN